MTPDWLQCPASGVLSYTPFVSPIPVWDYWYLLLLPLSAAVAVVYKSIKIHSMSQVPRQALIILWWIVFGMISAAAVLAAIVRLLELYR